MRALSIRQPFAELILRGIKTVELRSRATSIVGERFYIYAAKKPAAGGGQWAVKHADNIVVPGEALPDWLVELAKQVRLIEPDAILPKGVIVGSAIIEKVTPIEGQKAEGRGQNGSPLHPSSFIPHPLFEWHLADVKRLTRHRKPTKHPQPVWFNPF
jgi:hypothetical protein